MTDLNPQYPARAIVFSAAFVSGFVIMSIELLGGRILAPWFGSSVYVWGSIITVFMLSLALGYLWGGRLSTRNPNGRTYALFFLVAAAAILPLIFLGDWIMEQIFLRIEDPRYGSLCASILMYFLPTCILGMISPYSIRLLIQSEHTSGHVAGLLYFVSTLGSALGALGTSFYFVLWFEVNQILWGVILLLLLAGCMVVLSQRQRGSDFSGAEQYEN